MGHVVEMNVTTVTGPFRAANAISLPVRSRTVKSETLEPSLKSCPTANAQINRGAASAIDESFIVVPSILDWKTSFWSLHRQVNGCGFPAVEVAQPLRAAR